MKPASLLLPIILALAAAAPPLAAEPAVRYVDDNAPADPGPGNPAVSDPLADGTPAHPYDAIQKAINASADGDVIVVLDGTYTGAGNRDIAFSDKALTLRSQNGPAGCVVNCQGSPQGARRAFLFTDASRAAYVEGFTITNGYAPVVWPDDPVGCGGAVLCKNASPAFRNCIFTLNYAGMGGAIYACGTAETGNGPVVANCTFTANTAGVGGAVLAVENARPAVSNSILWGDSTTELAQLPEGTGFSRASYSDIAGGYPGTGNIDADPLFASASDLHLQSKYGRWTAAGWVCDAATNPCIDAGDPASPCTLEPKPNFGRINLGAYGNTPQASKSGWNIPGDANDDCRVNLLDLLFVRDRIGRDTATGDNWKADVTNDGKVNLLDLLAVRDRLLTGCK